MKSLPSKKTQNYMISIAHRIELKPNNKQKTYFRKAFGCARLAYNWGLAEENNAGEALMTTDYDDKWEFIMGFRKKKKYRT